MARLEDIPKKQFFKTPDGYFDHLPSKIQSRVAEAGNEHTRRVIFNYGLKYALPLVIVAAAILYYNSATPDAETILASVQTEDLIDYLQEAELSTEDLLEDVDFTADELEAIENEIYDLDLEGLHEATVD